MKLGYFFLAAFAISVCIVIFGEAGLLTAYRLSQENARLENRVETLRAENAKLSHDIESIQKSSRMLEHMVRSNLSLVAPDEILFEFQ